MAALELRQVGKWYGGFEAVKSVDLTIEDREFIVFVGPSGCGKTTLLRMIAGLEEISSGDLFIDGERANAVPPDKRGLAMVFQSYALYPHMTVAGNMGFALKMAGAPKAEIEQKVNGAARILQLEPLLGRKPRALSGGQRQRVAIGRAIVRNPRGFLFDEPLSNLDAALRVQMRTELVRLHQDLATTMIYVTHDQVEAMTMADRIVVLNGGRIEQVGTPLELYQRPANLFVAGFIGSPKMNLFPARAVSVGNGAVTLELSAGRTLSVPMPAGLIAPGAAVTLGTRPEHLALVDAGPFGGIVDVVEHLGVETLLYVKDPEGVTTIVRTDDLSRVRQGETVSLALRPGRGSLFDASGHAFFHLSPT
ncbi:MAG TPA: sn-glycerol-3-phosphate ABC transporter ATP-binding protein UgpC [Acetobacteraceae bacterium]|jgi:ABC-type sugar transport system ATPase subunit|nr:sn-glycerol-3-phosphate ABC transporter ATP-binding protein UgpC [Acetobacteraceae bacterium]